MKFREDNAPSNKSLDVRAKQLLFKICFGELGVARNRFRPTSIQSFGNKTMIMVRNAEAGDSERIGIIMASGLAILRKTYQPRSGTFAKRPEQSGKQRRVVAILGEQLIGTAEYYFEDESLCIMGLMVHHNYHRQGTARAIIRHLEEIAADRRIHSLIARTIRETGNVTIFEKLGFSVAFEQPDTLFESSIYSSLIEVTLSKRIQAEQGGGGNSAALRASP